MRCGGKFTVGLGGFLPLRKHLSDILLNRT